MLCNYTSPLFTLGVLFWDSADIRNAFLMSKLDERVVRAVIYLLLWRYAAVDVIKLGCYIIGIIVIRHRLTDKCNATVADLLPTLGEVDMSFLPGVAINMAASSSDLFDSSSSADDTSTDLSDTIDTSSDDDDEPDDEPISKKSRRISEREPIEKSAWWYLLLSPLRKEDIENDPHGKVAEQLRRAFRMSHSWYNERILESDIQMWWPDWHDYQIDAFGRIVGHLVELKWMGFLHVLGKGANHFSVSQKPLWLRKSTVRSSSSW